MASIYVPPQLRRPTPASPRVLREAMVMLRDNLFHGCAIQEKNIKSKRRVLREYVCQIGVNEERTRPARMWRRVHTYYVYVPLVKVVLPYAPNADPPFWLDISTQTTEAKYDAIVRTLYNAIEIGNQMVTSAQ